MNAQEIKSKYCIDYNPILGREFSGGRKEFDKELGEKRYEGLYKQIDFYLKKYAKEKSLSPVQKQDLNRLVKEISAYGSRGARWINEVKKTIKDSVDVEDKSGAWGSVVFAGSDKNMPASYKKIQERQAIERSNPAYQAAKKKWLAEMEKFMDGKIKVQPKMPKIEDFVKGLKDSVDEHVCDIMTYVVKSFKNEKDNGKIENIFTSASEANALVNELKSKGILVRMKKVPMNF